MQKLKNINGAADNVNDPHIVKGSYVDFWFRKFLSDNFFDDIQLWKMSTKYRKSSDLTVMQALFRLSKL